MNDNAPYTVTGIGIDGVMLSYEKPTVEDAGYLADKMQDNGVRDTCIVDNAGNEISVRAALDAFVRRGRRR